MNTRVGTYVCSLGKSLWKLYIHENYTPSLPIKYALQYEFIQLFVYVQTFDSLTLHRLTGFPQNE